MENVKENLSAAIGAQLTGAPDGPAKSELIEELSDNLYARYQDMTAAGMGEEDAYQSALDGLGDTAELVDYLNSLEPGQPLPGPEPEAGNEPGSGDLGGMFRDLGSMVSEAVSAAVSAVDVDAIVRQAMDTAKEAAKAASAAAKDAKKRRSGTVYSYDAPGGTHIVINTDGDREPEQTPGGPIFHGKDSWMEARGRGDYSFHADLRTVDVEVAGDITVRMDDTPDGDVVIGGDTDCLSVTSKNGVLTIRQGGTASRGFFFSRGLQTADVTLTLPRRPWARIRLSTTSGDVEAAIDEAAELMEITTVSGDIQGEAPACGALKLSTVNGDVEWRGNADRVQASSVAGDLELEGGFGAVELSCVSADACIRTDRESDLRCSAISGDLEVEAEALPRSLELSTKSGDIQASLPDAGPFSAELRSTSGELTSDFFDGALPGRTAFFDYQGGAQAGGPTYRLRTTSGDAAVRKL